MIHTVKGFSVVNEAEVDVFLGFFCFFCDTMDVGKLVSGSSAFCKSSLNIWKFLVRILLKPSFENFEHFFASVLYLVEDFYSWGSECQVTFCFSGVALVMLTYTIWWGSTRRTLQFWTFLHPVSGSRAISLTPRIGDPSWNGQPSPFHPSLFACLVVWCQEPEMTKCQFPLVDAPGGNISLLDIVYIACAGMHWRIFIFLSELFCIHWLFWPIRET